MNLRAIEETVGSGLPKYGDRAALLLGAHCMSDKSPPEIGLWFEFGNPLLLGAHCMSDKSPPEIGFWFEFGSPYSYLSMMRIEEAATGLGVRIVWRPFLLGPVFRALGIETSPVTDNKPKGAYIWQDLPRQARKYGLPWTRPSIFPRLGVTPARVALLGADQPWVGSFCRRVMALNFAEDRDINEPECLVPVLRELGLPATLLDEAQADANKARLRAQTDEARARGIFGAPTFFARGEMFWGNDRLDDALLFAANG